MTRDDDANRVRRLVDSFDHVVAHLGELRRALDALRLASRQRHALQAERRMGKTDFPLRPVADALVGPANDERFSAEALALTGFDAEVEARRDLGTRLRLQRLGDELAELVPRVTLAKASSRRR